MTDDPRAEERQRREAAAAAQDAAWRAEQALRSAAEAAAIERFKKRRAEYLAAKERARQ